MGDASVLGCILIKKKTLIVVVSEKAIKIEFKEQAFKERVKDLN